MGAGTLSGRVLGGRLTLEDAIGQGGMGAIYRAHHAGLDRRVAVKLVVPERATDPSFVARFRAEAKAMAKVQHPNVVRVLNVGEEPDGLAYLVMELIEGPGLDRRMTEGVSIGVACHVAREVLLGLSAIHAAGVVHRDIKPSNVLLLPGGGVKICDFGIAKLEQGSTKLTQTGVVVGTPAYLAPEQALGEKVDGRADVFAVGVMLYELLAGQLPYSASDHLGLLMARVEADARPIEQAVAGVPEGLRAVLGRALARLPAARLPSAAAFAAELAPFADPRDASAPLARPLPRSSATPVRRSSLSMILAPPAGGPPIAARAFAAALVIGLAFAAEGIRSAVAGSTDRQRAIAERRADRRARRAVAPVEELPPLPRDEPAYAPPADPPAYEPPDRIDAVDPDEARVAQRRRYEEEREAYRERQEAAAAEREAQRFERQRQIELDRQVWEVERAERQRRADELAAARREEAEAARLEAEERRRQAEWERETDQPVFIDPGD